VGNFLLSIPARPGKRKVRDISSFFRWCQPVTYYARQPSGVAKPKYLRCLYGIAAASLATGCSTFGSSGPSSSAVLHAENKPLASAAIGVVELTDDIARQLVASDQRDRFSELFGGDIHSGPLIGPGDVLEISLWEAPPSVLFGTTAVGLPVGVGSSSNSLSIPGSVVDENGRISIPFAGSIVAAGKTPSQIEREIVARLRGKAHQPQASVRLGQNKATIVTVVGDVPNSGQLPLTPKGERLLDVIAGAGGAKNAVNKTVIQLTRENRVASMPLEAIINDPRQNVFARPGDVINVQYQPYSFTAFGATGSNSELPLEATGINLAQALGRVGGLRDDRADARGVFVYRLEDPADLGSYVPANARLTADGKLPVIYRVDLKDPRSFFVAQSFPIRNRDVLFVSNAPMSDLQKFTNIVSSITFPLIGIKNTLDQ
jgi:polysaccharide export outer membrane protein